MVHKFRLTIVHVTCPNPMQICAYVWICRGTKNCGKSVLGRGLSNRAVAGCRAAGLLGHCGTGPWAVGRGPWAVGRGPKAAGCGQRAVGCGLRAAGLLAKPTSLNFMTFIQSILLHHQFCVSPITNYKFTVTFSFHIKD